MSGEEEKVTITFSINGTDRNPFEIWGLKQNPFPMSGIAELSAGEKQLASLGGEPIRSAEDIQRRLSGFDPSFVARVVGAWRPGYVVRITVTFPRSRGA
jgi:hypothetical protein